jgi:hypothetical protein
MRVLKRGASGYLLKNLFHKELFETIPALHDLDVSRVRCENDDPCLCELGTDGDDRLDSAHVRHLQVHERDIGTERTELVGSLHGRWRESRRSLYPVRVLAAARSPRAVDSDFIPGAHASR